MEITLFKIQWTKKYIAARADQKRREIDDLLSGRWCCVVRSSIGRKVEVSIQETLTIAHRDRLLLVDAKHFSNVLAVQLKIGDDPKLVEALQGHQQNKSYGGDPCHCGKDKSKKHACNNPVD